MVPCVQQVPPLWLFTPETKFFPPTSLKSNDEGKEAPKAENAQARTNQGVQRIMTSKFLGKRGENRYSFNGRGSLADPARRKEFPLTLAKRRVTPGATI